MRFYLIALDRAIKKIASLEHRLRKRSLGTSRNMNCFETLTEALKRTAVNMRLRRPAGKVNVGPYWHGHKTSLMIWKNGAVGRLRFALVQRGMCQLKNERADEVRDHEDSVTFERSTTCHFFGEGFCAFTDVTVNYVRRSTPGSPSGKAMSPVANDVRESLKGSPTRCVKCTVVVDRFAPANQARRTS